MADYDYAFEGLPQRIAAELAAELSTYHFHLSRAGLRALRQLLRRKGASKGFSGWALADLLSIRPAIVDVDLPNGSRLRIQFDN